MKKKSNSKLPKSTHTPQYDLLRKKLIQMRTEAKLTHRELAKRLGREHSFIWRIEQGERRLDFVEFFWVCRALDQDPAAIAEELQQEFKKLKDFSI